jgi:hypothetical protein
VLSITECKKILNRKGASYKDEEIEKIREALYRIAELIYKQKNN